MNKKYAIRHHYVWKNYFLSWATDGKVWWNNKGLIKNTPPKDILFLREMNKIEFLNEKENELFYMLKEKYSIKVHAQFLHYIERPIYLYRDKIKHNHHDKHINNQFGEEIHTYFESLGIEFINEILNKNTDFFYDQVKRELFLIFLFHQFFRTKRIRDGLSSEKISSESYVRIWKYIIFLEVFRLTEVVMNYPKTYYLKLIFNKNDTFITSDQPVINLEFSVEKLIPSYDFNFYYPISPKIGLVLTTKCDYLNNQILNQTQINELNSKILINHNEFIVAKNYQDIMI